MQVINKKIVKNISFLLFLSFLTGCSSSNSVYNLDYNSLTLGKNEQSIISIDFTNPILRRYSSGCRLNSYTLEDENKDYGKLFVEYIDLEQNCNWNGLPSSFFETSLKNELKLKSIKTVEEFDIKNYNFKTYKIDDNSYLSMIYIYGGSSEKFILDYEGKLYNKLLKSFNENYENRFLNEKRFQGKYNSSLVNKNIINNYYEIEVPADK